MKELPEIVFINKHASFLFGTEHCDSIQKSNDDVEYLREDIVRKQNRTTIGICLGVAVVFSIVAVCLCAYMMKSGLI